jgi:Flp pilus assembly protein TadB
MIQRWWDWLRLAFWVLLGLVLGAFLWRREKEKKPDTSDAEHRAAQENQRIEEVRQQQTQSAQGVEEKRKAEIERERMMRTQEIDQAQLSEEMRRLLDEEMRR